jgi:outer membrane protein OmpA-like peptidoglycan-associated protein
MHSVLRSGGDHPPTGLGSRVAAATETAPETAPTPTTAPHALVPTTTVVDPDAIVATATSVVAQQAPTLAVDPTTASAVEQTAVVVAASPLPTTTVDAAGDTTALADELGYPAAPDGTPLPIIATYDVGTVTLTGHVPGAAARDRLIALAGANSQDEAEVVDRLIVNEHVPANVGVRVIETNSPRFPEGDARITPEHAAQLDRVATIMQALPHVTVLVIGHADQRGDEAANLALSNDRARAVVDYLVYLGVEPTRVAAKAAGESNLLTLDDDDAALALNRRTEFVFSGILLG